VPTNHASEPVYFGSGSSVPPTVSIIGLIAAPAPREERWTRLRTDLDGVAAAVAPWLVEVLSRAA